MRIWIDPEKMSSYNITKRCSGCLKRQNVEAALVKLGNAEGIYEYVINIRKTF
jgi:multidrug efflux pump subunit AcrB